MIRVLIAEDNNPLSVHLSNVINSTEDAKVISIQSNGVAVLETIRKMKPDLVILDLALPNKNGMEIVKEIENESELKTQIIVYSGYPEHISKLVGYKSIVGFFCKGKVCDEQLGIEIKRISEQINNEIIEDAVKEILFNIGFRPSNIGTKFLEECILLSIQNNEDKLNVLYQIVGVRIGKRPRTIKGDIQSSIDKMWKYCNKEKVRDYFGLGDNENPSPKNVIPMVKYYAEKKKVLC